MAIAAAIMPVPVPVPVRIVSSTYGNHYWLFNNSTGLVSWLRVTFRVTCTPSSHSGSRCSNRKSLPSLATA